MGGYEVSISKKRGQAGGAPKPTTAELGILRVLWKIGPSTVREVHHAMPGAANTGYTTVLKFLQIMHQKGIVERDETQRAHVYRAAVSQQDTQRLMTDQLVDGVFEGRRWQLVLQALGDSKRATPKELAQIRALLDRLEQEGD